MSSDPKGPEPTPLSAELERAISARLLERPPTDPDEFSEFVAHVRAQLGYKDATLDAQATEIAALRGALEREKRSEWREGLVAVIDHEGNYLGCMGTMTWAVLARKEAQGD